MSQILLILHLVDQVLYLNNMAVSNSYTQKNLAGFEWQFLMACLVLPSDCYQLLPGEAYLNEISVEVTNADMFIFFGALHIQLAFTVPQDLHFRHLSCMHVLV